MADKSSVLILGALSKAAAAPEGLPLFGGHLTPGLFPGNQGGKQAAQRCREEGWLESLSPPVVEETPSHNGAAGDTAVLTRKKSKPPLEKAVLTGKGLTWLLEQTSPRQVLEDFVRVLEVRRAQAADMLAALQRLQGGFDALRANAEKVLAHVGRPAPEGAAAGGMLPRFLRFRGEPDAPPAGPPDVQTVLLSCLSQWRGGAGSEDCPLPELFRQVRAAAPGATIGCFHDALRRLHDAGRVYLHPWTGPLYDLPEPPYALLVGHEIAYYASIRQG